MNHEISKENLTDIPQEDLTENNIEPKRPRSPKRIGLIIVGVILLAGLGLFAIHAGAAKPDKAGKDGKKGNQVTPVTVAIATQKTVPVQLQAIGNVLSPSTVAVTPQAGGQIIGVYFKKGQEIKRGQLLFTLDNRTQNAAIQQAQGVVSKDEAQIEQARTNLAKDQGAVEQARATLAKDQGQLEQAKATLSKDQALVRQAIATLAKDGAQAKYAAAQSKRYTQLYKDGAISQDQAEQYITNNGVSVATLKADREAIANTQEVVKGDKVGITNAQQVVKGDIVAITNAQDVVKGDVAAIENAQAVKRSDLAALDSVKVQSSYTKIYAPMDGRAGNILVTQGNVVQANSTTPLVTIVKLNPIQVSFSIPEADLAKVQQYMENGKLKVNVSFGNDNNHPVSGILTFVNNTIDNTTGTIQLIGDFDNTQGRLFPGRFVNTTLTLTHEQNATVVPAQAVQNGPKGQFVFVAKPDMTVENVPVKVSSTIGQLSVIDKGVQPGDQVVTDGQANLVSGSKIRTKAAGNSGSANDPGNDSAKPKRHSQGKPAGGDSGTDK